MMLVSLLLLPGSGQEDVELPSGSTLADLVSAKNLTGRSIVHNGDEIARGSYASVALSSGDEVAALAATKGNG